MARHPRYFLIDLVMIVLLCGILFGGFRLVTQAGRQGGQIAFPALVVAFLVWFIAWSQIRNRRRMVSCPKCGQTFLPTQDAPDCPTCRQLNRDPREVTKEQSQGWRNGIGCLVGFTGFMALVLAGVVRRHFGPYFAYALPLAAVAATACLVGLPWLALLGWWARKIRLLGREDFVLSTARRCAGSVGVEARLDPLLFWSSGSPLALSRMLATWKEGRAAFETWFGEPIEIRYPLRALAFGRREEFLAFRRHIGSSVVDDGSDVFCLLPPTRLLIVNDEEDDRPGRIATRKALMRASLGHFLLEDALGFLPPPWIHNGITFLLSRAGEEWELASLNRRLVLLLGRDHRPLERWLRLSMKEQYKLVSVFTDQEKFAAYKEFDHVSCSLVDYLAGPAAPEGRRARFRAFLKDMEPGGDVEAIFRRHFEHGYDRLLADWRAWVLARGAGPYEPPPAQLRDDILERLIPALEDPQSVLMKRIEVIREMGSRGSTIGADRLIWLLRTPGDIPPEEVAWALESIAGLPLGDDVARWEAWWDELPPAQRDAGPLSTTA